MIEFLENRRKDCPICLKNCLQEINSNYLNVYSELIANHLNIKESLMIEKMSSMRCKRCDLRVWGKPLNKKTRLTLYQKILPIHPKGDDSSGIYFNYQGITKKLKGENNQSKKSRIIEGYLSSIRFQTKEEYKYFEKKLFELQCYEPIKDKLIELFDRGPKEFTRHSGFRDTSITKDITNTILKNHSESYEYVEYGSPHWGPINSHVLKSFRCLNIIPDNDIFWNSDITEIKKNSNHDFIKERDLFKKEINFAESSLGLILILDHLMEPYFFLKQFSEKNVKNIFILVEKEDHKKGLPVQHITCWNNNSLIALGESLGCKVSFPEINTKKYIYAKFDL
tara:strand:+ start:13711 stop:14724 length:1014 start_codon:yes stop_codon:yes gene_type:complete